MHWSPGSRLNVLCRYQKLRPSGNIPMTSCARWDWTIASVVLNKQTSKINWYYTNVHVGIRIIKKSLMKIYRNGSLVHISFLTMISVNLFYSYKKVVTHMKKCLIRKNSMKQLTRERIFWQSPKHGWYCWCILHARNAKRVYQDFK